MKTRFALLITMALLAVGLPIPAHAATPFKFTVSGGEATITGYNGTTPRVLVIPDEITDGNETYRVTTIGEYAFHNNQLTAVTLPDTLTTIDSNAFDNNQLTTLTLPDTLITIGRGAFDGNRLAALKLPDALTTIGGGAFFNNQLAALKLPDTLTTIGSYAFYNNRLTALTLPDALTTIDRNVFSHNRLTALTLPDALTTIDYEAFSGNQLTALTLPDTLTRIGFSAFLDSPLASVRLTGTPPLLEPAAFGINNPTVRFPWKFGTPRTPGGYTTPTWSGYDTIPVADVTFVGDGGASAAQSVDVDGASTAVKPADPVKAGHVFTGWYADEVTTPFDFTTPITGDTVLAAGFEAEVAPTLTGSPQATAKLGADVTWAPTLTGYPASTITATGLPTGLAIDPTTGAISGKVTNAALAGNHTVTITATNGIDPAATLKLTITIEGFTYSVTDGAATITGYHGAVPTKLEIPAKITDSNGTYTVTHIGPTAFREKWLTELTLPDTLTTIGNQAFAHNQLTALTLPDTLTTIGSQAFYGNHLAALTLPDTLTTIGNQAFGPILLASVRFTGPAPDLDDNAFGTRNPPVRFPWKFGAPHSPGGYTTPRWHNYSTIPVADVSFTGGGDIDTQSVDVNGTAVAAKPADPTKAGHVFTGWYVDEATTPFDFTTPITGDTDLTAGFKAVFAPTITGPATVSAKLGATVTWEPTITGDPAVTITATGLPAGLTIDPTTGAISGKVTNAALAGNHTVTITATNGIDPAATFELTISIEGFSYSVADGAATITGYHGTTPTELDIPAEITDASGTYPVAAIGNKAFLDKLLTTLSLPDGLITIGENAFHSNQLTDLRLPDSVTTIGRGAFASNRLTALHLPETLTTIGDLAFNANQLTTLDLPDTLTTIGDYAFNINRLTTLDLPDTLTTIGDWAFANNRLTTLHLPDTLTTIGAVAFYKNRLTTLDLPDALTTVGSEAFAENQLAGVRFTGKAPEMGTKALGTSDPSVRFPWKLGESQVADGYTTPLWSGYDTIPVADVTFAGGGAIAPQSVDVDGTSTVLKPAEPAKDGHVFMGWFADAATAPFDFAKPVTGDVVLTAGFEPIPVVAPAPSPSPVAPTPSPAVTGLDPSITGNAREGQTLRAKPGTVSPAGATVTYQWRAGGKAILGATKAWLPLRKAQAGKRITVTITAKVAGAVAVTKTSAKTKAVSSAKRRLVLSTYAVGKNKPVTVTATGFKARQKIIIWLGGTSRYVGRADSRGVVAKTVTFATSTEPGKRRIRVSGYQNDGDRNRTVHTAVRYR